MGKEDTPKPIDRTELLSVASSLDYMSQQLRLVCENMEKEMIQDLVSRQWKNRDKAIDMLNGWVSLIGESFNKRVMTHHRTSVEQEIATYAKPKRPNRNKASQIADEATNSMIAAETKKPYKKKG